MVTPRKGVYETLPLNAEGRKVGDTWDPARDEAAGEQCRAYGAGNIMRVPGRLHVTWADDSTLQIDTDAGSADAAAALRSGRAAAADADLAGPFPGGVAVRPGGRGGPGAAASQNRGGNLKVVTTHLRAGYVRKNGAPYSDRRPW